MGLEGLICTAMALPLAVPLGMMGAWFSFKARARNAGARSAALILLPLSLGSAAYDAAVVPAVYEVTTSVEIAASPETVWRHVITYAEMPAPTEWLFRTGIAYPRRVRLAGTGVGATRFCDFSTGSFVEPITVWEPARRLEFDVVASAAPMQEWSPYGAIQPAHLHGYFKSRKGRFVLKTLENGHTLLSGTSWYEHGLEPAPVLALVVGRHHSSESTSACSATSSTCRRRRVALPSRRPGNRTGPPRLMADVPNWINY